MAKKEPPKGRQESLFNEEELPQLAPPGKRLVCTPYITTRDGKILYASNYGRKAFCFLVDE